MWEALLQGLDGRILVVGTAGTLEEAQQQCTGLPLLADAESDRAKNNPKGGLAFALALAVVDVQLAMAALATVGGGDAADALRQGGGSYRWSLQRSNDYPR